MNTTTSVLAALALAALAHLPARADDHGRAIVLPPAYVQECGACHAPYPPGLLPNESWQRLMANLPTHFGTDASLDAPTQKALSTWLTATAGSGKRARVAPPEDRITRGDWFIREHREVPKAAWTRASIKSAANCGACHDGAAQGMYDEDSVHIPR
ncbi:diheme cytochrome c [Variovorax sp. YR752]|uniref:diheme cytochrome c n=1 Tax=Variovorax sp. YR752 TaxID=1884383 RepID=UPI0031380355